MPRKEKGTLYVTQTSTPSFILMNPKRGSVRPMGSFRLVPVLLLSIVVLSLGLAVQGSVQVSYVSASPDYQTERERAADYLLNMYNEALGLVANSEEQGLYNLTGVPEEEWLPCNSTYWVFSDNLWAGWALGPYNLTVAENITKAVQRYISTYGRSMLFEAAIGEVIPTTIQPNTDVSVLNKVVEGVRIQVLLDRHQYGDSPNQPFNDTEEYADLCFYMTINYWMMNDTRASKHWFRAGEGMWNSTTKIGFYDKGVWNSTDHLYSNFKLGLFLLAQKVTGFNSTIVGEVETQLWSCENAFGGIVTLCYLDGRWYGTANTETTAAALLSYNDELVNRLQQKKSLAEVELEKAEEKLENAEAKIRSLSSYIGYLTTIFLVSSVSLVAVALILGVKYVRLRRNLGLKENT